MKRVALHRGNTQYGVENSFEALNPDVSELSNTVQKIKFDIADVVMEVDVILKPPFLIRHNTNDKVSDGYIENPNIVDDGMVWSFVNVANKRPWELTEYDISRLIHKSKRGLSKNSKPLILSELLELAKQNKYKLYLDVKLPDYTFSESSNYLMLYNDTWQMMKIITKYARYDIIDCVVSFSVVASILIKYFNTFVKTSDKIRQGVFCWEVFGLSSYFSNILNTVYMYFVQILIRPEIVSYSYRLINRYPHFLRMMNVTDIKNRYVWSIHKSKLDNVAEFLEDNDLTAVVDTFDHKNKN